MDSGEMAVKKQILALLASLSLMGCVSDDGLPSDLSESLSAPFTNDLTMTKLMRKDGTKIVMSSIGCFSSNANVIEIRDNVMHVSRLGDARRTYASSINNGVYIGAIALDDEKVAALDQALQQYAPIETHCSTTTQMVEVYWTDFWGMPMYQKMYKDDCNLQSRPKYTFQSVINEAMKAPASD
ncbi:hypothetical protein GCM10007086_28770 [Photobacterium aphoticum]|nr:hypothetical protein GCM10007086_28770 [Photobacterium aphoticum]